MFVWGVLSVIQIGFLPGMILLKFLPTRWRLLPTLGYAFGLSLLANYGLVLLATSLHLYTRGLMLAVFFIELAAVVYLYRDALRQPLDETAGKLLASLKPVLAIFQFTAEDESPKNRLGRLIAFTLRLILIGYAVSVVLWAARTWLDGFGMVIDRWDAVVSWNFWAEQWAGNQFPQKTWEYPQLLPINLSVAYVFLGTTQIQLFNTAWLGLFNFYILLLLFDLALQRRTAGYFAAVIAAKFILKEFAWEYFHTAYADIPLAFFSFAAIFAVLQAKHNSDPKQQRSAVWIGMLLAAAAAVTKQGGIAMLVAVPLVARFLTVDDMEKEARRRLFWQSLGAALLLVLPWYVYVEVGILRGVFESNIEWVSSGIYGGMTYLERFTAAFQSLGIYGYLLVLLFVGGFWLDRTTRALVYGIVLPYFIVWAVFFGYDPRNFSLAFAFWGLGLGLLLEKLIEWGEKLVSTLKLGRLWAGVLVLALGAAVAAGGLLLTGERLTAHQVEQQRHILDDRLNTVIYEYFEARGQVEPVLTDYPLDRLPGLERVSVSFRDAADFQQRWDANPEVDLILMPNSAEKELKADILARIDAGEYELIFFEKNYGYYFIRRLAP